MEISSRSLSSFWPCIKEVQEKAQKVRAKDCSNVRAMLWHFGEDRRFRSEEVELNSGPQDETENGSTVDMVSWLTRWLVGNNAHSI
jgi:hypothetical protein